MQVIFWGVRGSLAAPGKTTTEFGGNTSCIEIKYKKQQLILDAGTGIAKCGDTIHKKTVHLLLSHYHFDHICGLPFFKPIYKKANTIHLYGPGTHKKNVESILRHFFSGDFFPVSLANLPATLHYHSLEESTYQIGDFQIEPLRLNHPGTTLGYVIQTRHHKIAYLCDHEPIEQFQHLKNILPTQYNQKLLDRVKNVDLLITDAHFTDKKYQDYKGWGHSPWTYATHLAQRIEAKKVILFHHAPDHGDKELKQNFKAFQKKLGARSKTTLCLAKEGLKLSLV